MRRVARVDADAAHQLRVRLLDAVDGGAQDLRGVKVIALHEIGHLLGLGHSGGHADIMAEWVTADSLSRSDRATARLLYALPPGRVGDSRNDYGL